VICEDIPGRSIVFISVSAQHFHSVFAKKNCCWWRLARL